MVLTEAQVEEEQSVGESEDTSSSGVSDSGKKENGFSIPCLGSSFLSVLPLLFVFTRRNICRI